MANDPIELDMRRGLPKIRRSFKRLSASVGACSYSAPCAIGAMMTPDQRKRLRGESDGTSVSTLAAWEQVVIPREQLEDFQKLQCAFDSGRASTFSDTLERLERKYLAVSA